MRSQDLINTLYSSGVEKVWLVLIGGLESISIDSDLGDGSSHRSLSKGIDLRVYIRIRSSFVTGCSGLLPMFWWDSV